MEDSRRCQVLAFLTDLTVQGRVSHSTQMQALSALLFLYRDVLRSPLGDIRGLVRASGPRRMPVVLSPGEVARVLGKLEGDPWLVAMLLYGAGLRLMEALALRVKDVHVERGEVCVRRKKGAKDRVTVLPARLKGPLVAHLGRVRGAARSRRCGRRWSSGVAGGAGPEGAGMGSVVGVAVGVSGAAALPGRGDGRAPAASFGPDGGAAGGGAGGAGGGRGETGDVPHTAAQLRHASTGGGLRHSDGAGTPWPQRRQHDDGLHPCPEPWRPRRTESADLLVGAPE